MGGSILNGEMMSSEQEEIEYVTLESALEAIEHVESHNGHDRASQARAMLIAQPSAQLNQNHDKFLIEFDDWSCCHSVSAFQVLMPYIPAKGQSIRIHKSLVSKHFSEDAYYDFDQIDDGCAEFTINHVEHMLDASGTSTRIDICHEEFTRAAAEIGAQMA